MPVTLSCPYRLQFNIFIILHQGLQLGEKCLPDFQRTVRLPHGESIDQHTNSPLSVQAADVDAIFRSSNGVIFKIPRKHLNIFSEGFAAPDVVVTDEEVPLPETAEILELLFQYCYPRRGPSLKSLPFSIVKSLAESVEKYQVYTALEPCKERMECVYTHETM